MLAGLLAVLAILLSVFVVVSVVWISPWLALALSVVALALWIWQRAKGGRAERGAPRHARELETPPRVPTVARHAAPSHH